MKVRNRAFGWLVLSAAACAVMCSVSSAFAQAAQPAGAERAMKYAPDGVAVVIHVDLKALAKDALAVLTKDPVFKDLDPNIPAAIGKFTEQVETIDVLLLLGEGGEPMPLVVIHGKIAPADVNDLLKALPDLPPGLAFEKKADGRYVSGSKEVPVALVMGGEAPEVPAGVLIGGIAPMLTKEFLAGLGKGKNEAMTKLLASADTAAPIWGAVVDVLSADEETPKTLAAAIYPLGGGRTKVVIEFKTADAAAIFTKAIQDPKGMAKILMSVMDLKADGATVTISSKTTDSLVPTIMGALAHARSLARRTSSLTNMSAIGKGIAIYQAVNKDQAPADFLALIADGQSPAIFYSPNSGKTPPKAEKGKVIGAFEPDYVYLKYPNLSNADPGCLVAYEKPEFYKNEGTAVLFADLHVEWVEMARFNELLKKSQDEIAKQEKEAKKDK